MKNKLLMKYIIDLKKTILLIDFKMYLKINIIMKKI